MVWRNTLLGALGGLVVASFCCAAEGPFFVTYTHQMEEPGNLEIATSNVTGRPGNGDRFLGGATELEYGLRGWWTTELYLDGQATAGQSTLFTGYRWENRFRLLSREHWINPVLYLEFENINGADKESARSGWSRRQGRSCGLEQPGPDRETTRDRSQTHPEQLRKRLDDRRELHRGKERRARAL
jgi:hypothetical protein